MKVLKGSVHSKVGRIHSLRHKNETEMGGGGGGGGGERGGNYFETFTDSIHHSFVFLFVLFFPS